MVHNGEKIRYGSNKTVAYGEVPETLVVCGGAIRYG